MCIMLKISSQNRYTVGISKSYFPKETWPAELTKGIAKEYFEVVNITATNRTEAAQKAWQDHGDRWLSLMGPPQASRRKVSLHVNEPKAGVGGKLGRLVPIEVYDESTTPD